jgi:2-polyprenyl-3-methyl-5-hydroxy-6-metoxy-1,4-benzoquinol methylase
MVDKWEEVRKIVDSESITLGPFYSGQLKGHWSLLRTMARYKFVANLVKDKYVLDVGCGEGLGTSLLGKYTKFIIGIDTDKEAIKFAEKNYSLLDKVHFYEIDIMKYINTINFDCSIAIDVIEHIKKKKEKLFMENICKTISDTGFCIIGTPNKNMKKYESKEAKMGHINMYDEKRLRKLMEKYFENVFIFGMNDEVVYTGFKPMCQYLFAIGVNKK